MHRALPWLLILPFVGLLVAVPLVSSRRQAVADSPDAERNERCAARLSNAIMGKNADDALRTSADPQAQVDAMVQSPEFVKRFSALANTLFNPKGNYGNGHAIVYHIAKRVLETGRPWKDVFTGPFNAVDPYHQGPTVGAFRIVDDPNGLGYFETISWRVPYQGNDIDHLKLISAARILHDVVGLRLVAVTNAADAEGDNSATGRQRPQCAGCHFENWYALDKVANILDRGLRNPDGNTFGPPPADASHVIAGKTVKNVHELVRTLVETDDYRFAQCRIVFQFLYGRSETACEGTLFDKCMDQLALDGKIQSAIAAVAKDPGFCE